MMAVLDLRIRTDRSLLSVEVAVAKKGSERNGVCKGRIKITILNNAP